MAMASMTSTWSDVLKDLTDTSDKFDWDELQQREHDTLRDIATEGLGDVLTDQLRERYNSLSGRYGTGMLIGMVRNFIPSMIANDIVGVAPMTGPTGTIVSVRPRYGSTGSTP